MMERPKDAAELLRIAAGMRENGRDREMEQLVRAYLRGEGTEPRLIQRVGSFLRAAPPPTGSAIRVTVLGQCTTSWLGPALTAIGCREGHRLVVEEGSYDNVMQDILGLDESTVPEVMVLLPWNERLLDAGSDSSVEELGSAELSFWENAWAHLEKRGCSRVVQFGYDWMRPGALGFQLDGSEGGDVGRIRAMNAKLRERLPAEASFLDLELLSGTMGRENFYDARRYFLTRQPFSEEGLLMLAEHLWAAVRAQVIGSKKLLVLDLDNTLWGGVVGETGPLGITLGGDAEGEAYLAFQQYLKRLTQRGVLLAVVSKNNEEDAREPFRENPMMVLSLDDFVAFEANWEPKSSNLRKLAARLRLGLDSFVFFDDSAFEREEVRAQLPEVEVVPVSDDAADYIGDLQGGLYFEAKAVTETDENRARLYRQDARREESREEYGSLEGYLDSLQMEARLEPVAAGNIERVAQLIARTNQFNLTTRRHSRSDVEKLASHDGAIAWTLSLSDRFGDYGLVSVIIAVPDEDDAESCLRVDTWLMSCRVIGRTVENFFFNELVEAARERGIRRVVGEFVRTPKNELVSELYPGLGFEPSTSPADERRLFRLELERSSPAQTQVRRMAVSGAGGALQDK